MLQTCSGSFGNMVISNWHLAQGILGADSWSLMIFHVLPDSFTYSNDIFEEMIFLPLFHIHTILLEDRAGFEPASCRTIGVMTPKSLRSLLQCSNRLNYLNAPDFGFEPKQNSFGENLTQPALPDIYLTAASSNSTLSSNPPKARLHLLHNTPRTIPVL